MRNRALNNFPSGHLAIHATAVLSLALTELWFDMLSIMIAWPYSDAHLADFADAFDAPWKHVLLGDLPLVQSMMVIYVVWCILVARQYIAPDTGLGIATACYGVFAGDLGRGINPHPIDDFAVSIGKNLVLLGDLACLLGVTATVIVGWQSFRLRRGAPTSPSG